MSNKKGKTLILNKENVKHFRQYGVSNAKKNKNIEEIIELLPGMKSPTVLPLAEAGLTCLIAFKTASPFSLSLSGENDSQYHLFHCSRLIDDCEHLANNVSIEYEDISLQIPAAKPLSEIWKVRKKILDI